MKQYYVYMMTNRSGTLYTGATNSLERRVLEHRSGLADGFTKLYKMGRLVYFDVFTDVAAAIAREKQVKGWYRAREAGQGLASQEEGCPRRFDESEVAGLE